MNFIIEACILLFILGQFWSEGSVGVVITLITISTYAALLHFAFGFPATPNELSKSGEDANHSIETLLLWMFISMLLGMASEYFYSSIESDLVRPRFDWKGFFKPFLVAPMVFIPLAASLQNARVDMSHFSVPLLMLILVAFENGFLWREYFTRNFTESKRGRTKRKSQ